MTCMSHLVERRRNRPKRCKTHRDKRAPRKPWVLLDAMTGLPPVGFPFHEPQGERK